MDALSSLRTYQCVKRRPDVIDQHLNFQAQFLREHKNSKLRIKFDAFDQLAYFCVISKYYWKEVFCMCKKHQTNSSCKDLLLNVEIGSKELVFLSYAIVCFHPSVSFNNEKNYCEISKIK